MVSISYVIFVLRWSGADPGILERGAGKGAKPRVERRRRERRRGVWGPSPENFEKLDAISCNLVYIFGIKMASDIIQNWAFAEQKTVAATISIPIQIQFPKYFFRRCIQCKKIN